MSFIKTNFKMGMNESDTTVAELITDGCNMGIKSLNKYSFIPLLQRLNFDKL